MPPAASRPVRLGLGPNWRQFSLLVVINAFVGAMVGIERTVLPLLAEREFAVASTTAALSFIVAFGATKSLANLAAGHLADRLGRRRMLIAGWLIGIPVAPMILWAPSWGWIVTANLLLGVNQGLAWSATVVMKIDLAGPRRRGLALGLNEAAGYVAVAVTAWATGALAAAHGPRPAPFILGIGIAAAGTVLSVLFVRDTRDHARLEGREHPHDGHAPAFRELFSTTSFRQRSLSTACHAGLVNNLNDGMVWGLMPLLLASGGLGVGRIGVVAAVYPAVWGLAQLVTGAWSDRTGRKPLIVGGLAIQAVGIIGLVIVDAYPGWLASAAAMGVGTAMVYPTLIAVVSDVAHPTWRASAVGVYRLWRDSGFVVGALLSGVVADLAGLDAAVVAVGAVTAGAALLTAVRMDETLPGLTDVRRPAARSRAA